MSFSPYNWVCNLPFITHILSMYKKHVRFFPTSSLFQDIQHEWRRKTFLKSDLLGHSHFRLVVSIPFLYQSTTPKTNITRASNTGGSCSESLLPEIVKPRALNTGEKKEGCRADLETITRFSEGS